MKPARRTHVRFVLAALLLLGALQSSTPAVAQQVGSACSPANKVIYPTYFTGTSQAYVCDGAHLVLLESDTAVPLQKGIGTANPQATLDVNGEVRVGNTGLVCSATTVGAMRYNSVNLDVEYCNGTSWTGSGGAVSWSGLTNPTAALALTMGANTSSFTYNAATGVNDLFKLIDTPNNTGTGALLSLATATGSKASPLNVKTQGNQTLQIIPGGSVVIGDLQGNTNDAIEQLEVVSGGSGNQIKWGNPTVNSGTLNGFLGFDGGSNTIDIVAQNGNMALYSGNSLSMYLDMHQNVGIGTATPKSALDVRGGVAIGSYAGTNAAPSNGLIVSGQTIIGLSSDFPDGVGPHKLAVAGTDGSNVFALENTTATQQFAFYINNGFPASPVQMGSITNSRYGIFTNNAFPQFTLDPNGGAEIGSGYYAAVPPASGLIVQGNVGIGTTTPQATLDVKGYLRLAKNSAQPVACSSTNDGAIALTHVYTLCVCNGGSTSWVQSKDGTTACSW